MLRALGARHVLNSREHPDWADEVRRATGGRRVDRVIEVAGSSLSQSLRATRFGGEPGANPEELIESSFQAVATQAKENCLVSRLLKTEVTLTARRWPEDEEPVDK